MPQTIQTHSSNHSHWASTKLAKASSHKKFQRSSVQLSVCNKSFHYSSKISWKHNLIHEMMKAMNSFSIIIAILITTKHLKISPSNKRKEIVSVVMTSQFICWLTPKKILSSSIHSQAILVWSRLQQQVLQLKSSSIKNVTISSHENMKPSNKTTLSYHPEDPEQQS